MRTALFASLAVLLAVGAAVMLSRPATALINPKYTPRHLFEGSKAIFLVEVGPLPEEGELPVKVVRAIKGEAPKTLTIQLAGLDDTVKDDLATGFGKNKIATALIFFGDAREAAIREVDKVPAAILYIGWKYFGLFPDGDKFRLAADPLDMRTVWAGNVEMLTRLFEFLQREPGAEVPVESGMRWTTEALAGQVQGKVAACLAADLLGDGRPYLLVLSDAGDRAFRANEKGEWAEATRELKLTTKSSAAACGDFNGDGRLDLALSDGKTMTVCLLGETLALTDRDSGVEFAAGCVRLQSLEVGAGRAAGLLVSTAGAPLLLLPKGDGTFTARALVPDAKEAPAAKLGAAGPAVAADLDGDGIVDVLQAFENGMLFFKGLKPGEFSAPAAACEDRLGPNVTSLKLGDFDADGLLDFVGCADGKSFLLHNRGGGRFLECTDDSGDVGYAGQKGRARQAALYDVNLDGRQEFALFFGDGSAQFFFNRGFYCFGVANELVLGGTRAQSAAGEPRESAAAGDLGEGQQAACAADFNGDGADEVASVGLQGQTWVIGARPAQTPNAPPRSLAVSLSVSVLGPVTLVGYNGARCLGARLVEAGQSATFGTRNPGGIRVEWTAPNGKKHVKTVAVVKAARLTLPTE